MFGDIGAAVRSMSFEDRRTGIYISSGGLIGNGTVLVDRYRTTASSFDMSETDFINYERAIEGAAVLEHGTSRIVSAAGTASVARQAGYRMAFRPTGKFVEGYEICLSQTALDSFLATAGEERAGPVGLMAVGGASLQDADRALLSIADFVLLHYELYRTGAKGRRGNLAEALVTDLFVQFLRDTGSLRLKPRLRDARGARIKQAQDFIHAHLGDPLTSADVAAAAGMSLRSLQAGFRELLGTTPREYITAARLERTREVLKPGDAVSVSSAAYGCGIVHLARFSSKYREVYGELPSSTLANSRGN